MKIAVLAGDGIGPEVTAAAVRVLRTALPELEYAEAAVGAAAIARYGMPLPATTIETCEGAAAILFGAIGGPGFDHLAPEQRPEFALLSLRRRFGLYANLRPAFAFAGLEERSPLRPEVVRGTDMIIVRELTGGLYYGAKTRGVVDGVDMATDMMVYDATEIERVARVAFGLARTRRRRVTSVDKANVLNTSQLWREVVTRVAADYPDVSLAHMLVDNAAMQIVRDPRAFDVIVTENTFGDILSDEAAMVTGTIGNAASASLAGSSDKPTFGLYEPISGTAPDIAGRDIANPSAAILSAAMLARFSLDRPEAADRIEAAVAATLAAPATRTADLTDSDAIGTQAFAEAVVGNLTPLSSRA
jgi:3-isopropylmalate dehydrogenase